MNSFFNKYLLVEFQIIFLLLIKRKFSIRKLVNLIVSFSSYFIKFKKSGKYPIMMNFELWNECNEACVFCRNAEGIITDPSLRGDEKVVSKGKLDIELYKKLIEESKSYLTLSVPYINGEPLLAKSIYESIDYASKRSVGTLIATNGIILNKKNIEKLIDVDLDFIKIHVSGMTSEIHNIEHRKGNAEQILENIKSLVRAKEERKHKMIIMFDYILYDHNKHQLQEAKDFAKEHKLIFNIRPGLTYGIEHIEKHKEVNTTMFQEKSCVWPWTILTVDWNGSLYPCCDHVVFTRAEAYDIWKSDYNSKSLAKLWNEGRVVDMRETLANKGRKEILICSQCPRSGVGFKY